MAVAHDVTVIADDVGGTAAANIDNGSSDPDSDTITVTQTPAGPYGVGTTSVLLTVVDAKGATAQATANVTVVDPGFTLAPTLPSVTVTAGQSIVQHITFTPNPATTFAMTLACSNLPSKASCSFVPATVPAGSAQTDVVLTISTTAQTTTLASSQSHSAAWLAMAGLGLIGVVMAMPSKRRGASSLLMTLLFMGALTALVGCGNSNSRQPTVVPGTPAGTYTVTVTGTSGSATQTTTFSLTVN
jgi:hypothetical protein